MVPKGKESKSEIIRITSPKATMIRMIESRTRTMLKMRVAHPWTRPSTDAGTIRLEPIKSRVKSTTASTSAR